MARTLTTLIGSLVAGLALAAAATAATGPGAITAGTGCSVACIESALVTTTASSASVEVKTSVPASVTVAVSKLDAKLGLAAGQKHVSVPSYLKVRTVLFPGLEPETTYRIVVSARDIAGTAQTRSGTFTTKRVEGRGRAAGPRSLGRARLQGRLHREGAAHERRERARARASRDANARCPATMSLTLVVKTISGKTLHFFQHVDREPEDRAHARPSTASSPGTTYQVTAKATDAEGRTRTRAGHVPHALAQSRSSRSTRSR